MLTDEQLSALLRSLKRHEVPPPGYFDNLLHSVHRRQREDLLRRPLWKIALERWQTFFSAHSMGSLSYAGSMGAVLVAGVVSVTYFTREVAAPGGSDGFSAGPALAAIAPASPRVEPIGETAMVAAPSVSAPRSVAMPDFQVANAVPLPPGFNIPSAQPRHVPRYVIDARPVSYAPTLSF